MDEGHIQYLAAMKPLEGRDFKQERRNIRGQMEQIENLAKVSTLARKGNYVLE